MADRPTKRQRTLTGYSAGTTNKAQVKTSLSVSSETKHDHAPWHSNSSSSVRIGHSPADFGEESSASCTQWPADKGGAQALSTTNQSHRRPEYTSMLATSADQSSRMHDTTTATTNEAVEEDIIDDYDSCDELFTKHFSVQNLANQSLKPKPHRNGTSNTTMSRSRSGPERPMALPKRFVLPAGPDDGENIPRFDSRDGSIPWAQRYRPLNLDELAVHKKKVSDVRRWLEASFMGVDESRLLVLRGPAGSGKTSTVSLLSKELNFDILEWKNPLVSQLSSRGSVSTSSRFDEFLERCHDFKKLDLNDERGAQAGSGTGPGLRPRRIVLIEEFPTFSKTWSSSLAAFRFSLYRYLAMAKSSTPKAYCRGAESDGVPPIVVIVSEALLNFSSETLTVNRLLGPEICNHPHTKIIEFNSIAPTIMYKALKDVLQKHSRHSGKPRFPKAAMLHNVSKIGDIRSAISSLEFLCRGTEHIGKPTKRPKKPQDSEALTPTEKETLKLVTHREASLGIFHAIGKIIYNKREDKNITADAEILTPTPTPDHLIHHNRLKVPQVSVNELADATGTDIPTFIYALHENYVPSCNGPSFTDSLDGCINALSDSDALCFNHDYVHKSWAGARAAFNSANASIDVMRQQDISYQVATRGLLFALPYPVKRQIKADGRGGEAHRLSFPTAFRLSYDAEELDSLTNLWQKRVLYQSESKPCFLEDHHSPSVLRKLTNDTDGRTAGDCNCVHPPIVTMMSRRDMLLYQLPYMLGMPRNRSYFPELRKLVEFAGIYSERRDQVDFLTHRHSGAAPRSSDGVSSMLDTQDFTSGKECSSLQLPLPPDQEAEGSLLLSDDDIVDY